MRNGCSEMRWAWVVLATVAGLGGCIEERADGEPSCTTETGEPYQRPCSCDTGGIGFQVCDASGAWGACSCPGQGAPAPAGTGGNTSGTGGVPPVVPMPDAGMMTIDSGAPVPTPDAGGDATTSACAADTDCIAPTPACDTTTGVCVACTMDAHCAPGSCDTATNTCATGCKSNADCSAPTPACDTATGTCVACTSMSDCSGTTPVCGPDQTCVACVANTDCPVCFPPSVPCCGVTTDNACTCELLFCPM